jgi:hypothetical protein
MTIALLKRLEKGDLLTASEHDSNLTAIETSVNVLLHSAFAQAEGDMSAAESAKSWKLIAAVTDVPIASGWYALFVNTSGSSHTITPASGVCVRTVTGDTAAAVTLANNKAATVIGDGANLIVLGDVQ